MPKIEVYATLLVLTIIFTTIDVVVSSFQLAIPSLIFSSITMVIGFIGAYLGKTIQVEQKYENAVGFIKKNFSIANTVLCILDVLSCILALLTGVLIILLIFRVTIAIRIAIYINKYRSIAFAVWGIAYMHIFKRSKRRKVIMTKFTTLQKILTTITAIFGVGGVVVMFMPEFAGMAQDISKYVAMASEIIAVVSGIWLSQTHDEVMTEEEIKAKENKGAEKKALKEAKAELKKAQEQAIKELAEKKMQEIQEEPKEVKVEEIQIAKEV